MEKFFPLGLIGLVFGLWRGPVVAVETRDPTGAPAIPGEESEGTRIGGREAPPEEGPGPPFAGDQETPFVTVRAGVARACLKQGRRLWEAGDYQAAQWLLDLALQLDGTLVEAHFWRGRIYLARDELDRAAREFKIVLAQKPNAAETLYQLGRIAEEKERWEDARVLYRRAQALRPGQAEVRTALGRLGPAPLGPPPPLEEVLARIDYTSPAQRLQRRLRKHRPVTIVALGDSLTWGMGLAHPELDSFPALFATMLRERFQDPNITLIGAGLPGETSSEGLERLNREVLAYHPHLVLVQYGGNDEFQKVPSTEYQENLRQIVKRVQESSAAVLLATPPMKEPQLNTLFPRAAREVGMEMQVPVADFDAAVKAPPCDFRGPFPLGEHPHEYSHLRMAQSFYTAFEELVNLRTPFSAVIKEGAWYASLGTLVSVKAQVHNESTQEHAVQLTLTVEDDATHRSLNLQPGEGGEMAFPVALPKSLRPGRSWTRRLWLGARNGAGAAFDLKWLTAAPILPCPPVPQAPRLTRGPQEQGLEEVRLGPANLLSDPQSWNGLYDLGASFSLTRDGKNLYFLLHVLDDRMLLREPHQDGVELFFDLRPPGDRGRPVYDDRCFALAARPSSYGQWTQLRALGEEPPGWATITGISRRHLRGYSLLLTFPFRTLERIAGRPVTAFGFDLLVHDADASGPRKTILAWSGRKDNLINPSGFGEVRLADEVDEKTVRVAVF